MGPWWATSRRVVPSARKIWASRPSQSRAAVRAIAPRIGSIPPSLPGRGFAASETPQCGQSRAPRGASSPQREHVMLLLRESKPVGARPRRAGERRPSVRCAGPTGQGRGRGPLTLTLSPRGRGEELLEESGLGDVPRGSPVFLEELPHLVRSARLEDAGAAVRGVGQTLRVPGKVLLHLGEDLTLETVLLDQGHVPADYAILVLALGSGRKRLEGLVEDPGAAERAAADHHGFTARLRHHAARGRHGVHVAVAGDGDAHGVHHLRDDGPRRLAREALRP